MSEECEVEIRNNIIFNATKGMKITFEDLMLDVPEKHRHHVDLNLMISVLLSLVGSLVANVACGNEPDLDAKDALSHPKSREILKVLAHQILNINYDHAYRVELG